METHMDTQIKLTKLLVCLFFAAVAVICAAAPRVAPWFAALRGQILTGKVPLLLATTYACAVPAVAALVVMYRLLDRIGRRQVFVPDNVRAIRQLAVCCLAAAVICAASALYYPSFWMLAVPGAFMALLLRVLASVFAQAVALKADNDLTI